MSEFKFACPLCDQHMQCDARMAGRPVQCPACGGAIQIPVPPPVSAPASPPPPAPSPPAPTASPVRVAIAATAHAATAHATPAPPTPAPVPARPSAALRPGLPGNPGESKGGGLKRVLAIAGAVVVFGAAAFGVFKLANMGQSKFNEARQREIEDGEGGGQVGHIAELYQVLDATDLDKMRDADLKAEARRSGKYRALAQAAAAATPGAQDLPVIKPTWSLDLAAVKIPASKVNGMIGGTEFLADAARLDAFNATTFGLTLRQGTNFAADREATVYLRLKAGEKIQGHTWTVASDATADIPSVAKRWKASPGTPLRQQTYKTGYALKLEFDQATEGTLPGRIYLALPDDEHSVLAGSFLALIRLPNAPQPNPAVRRDDDWGE